MSEISRPFPIPSGSSKTSPARDPRRPSRQDNPTVASSVTNVPPPPTATRSRSYGESLIESIAHLSSEVSTNTKLTDEYSKAKRAQKGINQHFEKLRNLNQFPAAEDLVKRIRDAQNKDVDSLKEQLAVRKERQKKMMKVAAALIDSEVNSHGSQSDAVKRIEAETKSTKLSVQLVKDDFNKLRRDVLTVSERNYTELQKLSGSQSEEVKLLKKSQNEDFALLRRVRDRVDRAFEDISDLDAQIRKRVIDTSISTDHKRLCRLDADVSELKRSLADRALAKAEGDSRQTGDLSNTSPGVDHKLFKILADRVNALEKEPVRDQANQSSADYDTLSKSVNHITSRLEAIERRSPLTSTTQLPPDTSSIESRYIHLKTMVDDMRELQAFKDDTLAQAIEENETKLKQQLEETVTKVKAEVSSDLEKAVTSIKHDATPQIDKVGALREVTEVQDQRLQTVETAIGSLEARYGSITLETMVHQALPYIQRAYPPPLALHSVVERFHALEVHLGHISNIPHLAVMVERQSQQLAAFHSRISAVNESSNHQQTSAAVPEMQRNWAQVEKILAELKIISTGYEDIKNKFASFTNEIHTKYIDTQKQLLDMKSENDRVAEEISSMSALLTELKSQPKEQTGQSKDSQAESIEQTLKNQVQTFEYQLEGLEQKIGDVLGSSGLEDAKVNLENLEVALQQHVENLTHQLMQLEDKQKSAALELSDLQKSESQLDTFTHTAVEDLERMVSDLDERSKGYDGLFPRLDDLEQARASLEQRIRVSESAKSARSPSPSRNKPNDLGDALQEDEVRSTASGISNHSKSSWIKKNKRKLSKMSSSHSSQYSTPVGGSPIGTPPGGTPRSERSGPPSSKKRRKDRGRSLAELVNNAEAISADD